MQNYWSQLSAARKTFLYNAMKIERLAALHLQPEARNSRRDEIARSLGPAVLLRPSSLGAREHGIKLVSRLKLAARPLLSAVASHHLPPHRDHRRKATAASQHQRPFRQRLQNIRQANSATQLSQLFLGEEKRISQSLGVENLSLCEGLRTGHEMESLVAGGAEPAQVLSQVPPAAALRQMVDVQVIF